MVRSLSDRLGEPLNRDADEEEALNRPVQSRVIKVSHSIKVSFSDRLSCIAKTLRQKCCSMVNTLIYDDESSSPNPRMLTRISQTLYIHATFPWLLKKGDFWVVWILNCHLVHDITTVLFPCSYAESIIHYGYLIWDTGKKGKCEIIKMSSRDKSYCTWP